MGKYVYSALHGAVTGFIVFAGIFTTLEIASWFGFAFQQDSFFVWALSVYPIALHYYVPSIHASFWFLFEFVVLGTVIGALSKFLDQKFPKIKR